MNMISFRLHLAVIILLRLAMLPPSHLLLHGRPYSPVKKQPLIVFLFLICFNSLSLLQTYL